jgi:glutamine amidotransferase-like uncharacterized protein
MKNRKRIFMVIIFSIFFLTNTFFNEENIHILKALQDSTKIINVLQIEGNINNFKNCVLGTEINITQFVFEDRTQTWSYKEWYNLFCKYEVLLFAGSSATDQYNRLGDNGRKALLDYVENGGSYLGISSGAFLASKQMLNLANIKYVDPQYPGIGELEINMTKRANTIFTSTKYQSESKHSMRIYNGPVWSVYLPDSKRAPFSIIARYTGNGETNRNGGSIFKDRPAIIRDTFGLGSIILFSGRPEINTHTGIRGMVLEAIRWLGKNSKIRSQLTPEEYKASLTADFGERDRLPQTLTPERDWYKYSSWGPTSATYPKVVIPLGVNPVKWQRDRVLEVAKKIIGTPYEHAKIPAIGFDCSNFTAWVYNYGLGNKFTGALATQSETVGRKVGSNELRKEGDLLYTYNSSRTRISHAMIYIDEYTLIDSTVDSKADGVEIRPFKGWYKNQYAYARRVIE